MNYGQHGRTLLQELKRSEPGHNVDSSASACTIPSYNDLVVGNAIQDLRLHCQALQDQVEATTNNAADSKPSIHVRPSLLLQNAAVQRNKRCLLTYHVVRLQRIQEELYWKQQTNESKVDAKTTNGNLCPAERVFLQEYADLVRHYTRQATNGSINDLRSYTSMPPQPSDRVLVRVMVNMGPMVLDSGASAVLSKGSTHFLLYSDVEEAIREGKVLVLNGEEDE
ncbi:hypothetical protein MPSEU_000666600 [Mayamaea pseudoterrestris]|nr:hypothetical protein MPSEU_000666600 [Mayamaea pseudoterrestris]